MHYYKRNIGDYAKKAGRLSMLEHGAYTLLLDACYDRERFPTLDEAIEWTWARTDAEIEAVKFVLSRFFTLEDGRYVQARIAEEVAKYHETSTKNAQIAAEREAKRKQTARSVHATSPAEHEAPPNQEPLTNNQEPKENMAKTGDADLSPILDLEDEPDVPTLASVDTCPHQAIVALFAEVLPSARQVRDWTPARQQLLRSRWREDKKRQDLAWWRRFFTYVGQSDFLMGRSATPGRKPFELGLEWLLKSENFAKVREGAYHEAEVTA
jgi:uncharacterized protein YdaU (DUF1376 family)